MRIHEVAEIFPPMKGPEFEALVDDIKVHGQREPITVVDGAILDGVHRHRACERLGIEPITVEWDGAGDTGDPVAYVLSKNLYRRHLDESQRAMIAARLATAKPGRKKRGQICPLSITAKGVGEMLNVSRGSVVNAKKVIKHGTTEEIAAVDGGEAAGEH